MLNLATSKLPLFACLLPVAILKAKTCLRTCFTAAVVARIQVAKPSRRSCQMCQRTKADHGGPRGVLHPLPLPSRRGWMIGVDFTAKLPSPDNGGKI